MAALRIRLISLSYEAVLLVALLLLATAVFVALSGGRPTPLLRFLLQVHLLLTAAIYFLWSWTGGRQTLPMRTWRLRLVDAQGNPPTLRAAGVRFLVALLGVPLGAIAILWSLWDPEQQFLHDRVARTRLVRDPPA